MEQSLNALQEMDKLPVSKAVFKNILPSIGIFLMMLIYNYADLFFIGMTHNDYMVSAVTLASPIFMFFMAFGSLFGTGGLTLISQDKAAHPEIAATELAQRHSAHTQQAGDSCNILFPM